MIESEGERIDALRQLGLIESPPSESFDRITRMAGQIFSLEASAISLTDSDRQWFMSRLGVSDTQMPRHDAPCNEVTATGARLLVPDLLASSRYAQSTLAGSGARFYAGAPLTTREGHCLGALCVVGASPRTATEEEMSALDDLAAMVMAQIELRHAFGRVDPVSALPNRNQFIEDLQDLARDHPGEQRFAVVVDLARDDQIGRITRAMGGARVDDLVREASKALQTALGPERRAYHVGAAQFAFLSPPNVEEAAYLQLLTSSFELLRASSSVRFVTSVSMGVRPFTLGQVPPDDLLRGAASAAQDSKGADGSIALYSPANDTAHRRQYTLLRDFSAALEATDQLRLVYQPRIELATGQCIGAEALLRWRHPVLGDISPAEFIPIIEQTSLARSTTQWVLDAAMNQLASWTHDGITVGLSVNISAANLRETDLIKRIQLGLLKRALRPEQLEIELTESAIMDQPEQALATLRELAAAGICLAIDDFGTGHSSLAYLQQLPARVLKIDQAFIRNLTEAKGQDFVLVETMIGLAQKLGYRCVAEGVETPDAAAILAQTGCEEAQGFLFARPMDAEQFTEWRMDRHTHELADVA